MPVRTELVWDGKFDNNGMRVAPLPFQNVETIDETAQARQRNLFQQAAQEQSGHQSHLARARSMRARQRSRPKSASVS
jgi:hypothetical protein